MKYQNVVIGTPIVDFLDIFSKDIDDWENNEKNNTLFTNERYLPRIMVECGVVKSSNEVRKNKPELNKTLNNLDYMEVKWGKSYIYILIGE